MLMAELQTMLHQQVNCALHRASRRVIAAAYGMLAIVRDSRCVQMWSAASTATRTKCACSRRALWRKHWRQLEEDFRASFLQQRYLDPLRER